MASSIYDLGFLERLTTEADQRTERWAKPWRLDSQLPERLIGVDRLSTEMHQLWDNALVLEREIQNVIGDPRKALQAYQLPNQATSDKTISSGALSSAGALSTDHSRLIFALHRDLVQEYCDLLLAGAYAGTQDDASEPLKQFCYSRQVPYRLWKYGIQGLLDFWRQRLPDSKEYLHAYINLCYNMLTMLLETVKDFERSWLECLGDLSRYRMAIEKDNANERAQWINIADNWYVRSWRLQPDIGRLLHHRAILARRVNTWRTLGLLSRALSAIKPFNEARNSLATLVVDPTLKQHPTADIVRLYTTVAFIRTLAHDLRSHGNRMPSQPSWNATADGFCHNLGPLMSKNEAAYDIIGECIGVANIAALLGWGEVGLQSNNVYRSIFDAARSGIDLVLAPSDLLDFKRRIFRPQYFFFRVLDLHMSWRSGDQEEVLRFVHLCFVFLTTTLTTSVGRALLSGLDFVPWTSIARFLNRWQRRKQVSTTAGSRIADDSFIHPVRSLPGTPPTATVSPVSIDPKTSTSVIRRALATIDPTPSGDSSQEQQVSQSDPVKLTDTTSPSSSLLVPPEVHDRVLPEDHTMQGQVWTVGYLSEDFLEGCGPLEEEAATQNARRDIFTQLRVERLLWLGWRMAKYGRAMRQRGERLDQWIEVNDASGEYSVCNLRA